MLDPYLFLQTQMCNSGIIKRDATQSGNIKRTTQLVLTRTFKQELLGQAIQHYRHNES